jgi:excisionase family DNA binding protein
MDNNAAKRWLSRRELADRLGLPVKTLARWASNGTGPPYARMGRHVRYRISDVIDWETARVDDNLGGGAQPGALTNHRLEQVADRASRDAHSGNAENLR